ncbi:hypothetical protein M405DRAFT_29675 [Rhizopogon salebrosus TDB-379]|nr:hypothetical protein M405DRAFT_29675 [Rhizopogon salebrosus TDB-379]
MVILTQIAKNCEILPSPIFGSCLAAYISQKAVNHKSFPSFSLFSFPTSSTISSCNDSSTTTSYFLYSLWLMLGVLVLDLVLVLVLVQVQVLVLVQ